MTRLQPRVVLLAICVTLCGAASASTAPLRCPTADTLDRLVSCLREQVIPNGSGLYRTPTAADRAAYRTVVRQMLQGVCSPSLPQRLAAILERRPFTDAANGRTYCRLMEVLDADGNGLPDRGWGTLIVYKGATRELSQQVPHPLADRDTEAQAMIIFRDTSSRSFVMAGAHRSASSATGCDGEHEVSDVAHDVGSMFHAANQELSAFYGSRAWTAIQWHGNTTCEHLNAYISTGLAGAPGPASNARALRNRMAVDHPEWVLTNPPDGQCSLDGTTNLQGRLLNGVAGADVCTTAATSSSDRFVHIEQNGVSRRAVDWVAAVRSVWPVDGIPVAKPAIWPLSLKSTADADDVRHAFGPRNTGRYDFHAGLDLPCTPGQPAHAVMSGKVVDVREHDGQATGPGNRVLMDHGDGQFTAYLHLAEHRPELLDTFLSQGDVIAPCGDTGAATPHLHLTYLVGLTSHTVDERKSRSPFEILPHGALRPLSVRFTSVQPQPGDEPNAVVIRVQSQTNVVKRVTLVDESGRRRTADYYDIVAQGNPTPEDPRRDNPTQFRIVFAASPPSVPNPGTGSFTLTLRPEVLSGRLFTVDRVILRDYRNAVVMDRRKALP
jgi:murein DD-endopeptidase MepM/ murein hydrolase activator NlpD